MVNSFKVYWEIFLAFLAPSSLTFGGGPASIGLMQQQVVEKYGWLSIEEFTNALALGNSLPGPIATKMSAVIGYKVGGWLGGLIGIISTVMPTAIAIIALYRVYNTFKDATWMQGMMKAVRPVIVMLLAQAAVNMIPTAFTGSTTIIIGILAGIVLMVLKIHPIIAIVTALAFGGIFLK